MRVPAKVKKSRPLQEDQLGTRDSINTQFHSIFSSSHFLLWINGPRPNRDPPSGSRGSLKSPFGRVKLHSAALEMPEKPLREDWLSHELDEQK